MAKLRVTWIKSDIGYAADQKRTIRALGLRRLNHTVVHDDTATVRGMLNKVEHLVKFEVVKN